MSGHLIGELLAHCLCILWPIVCALFYVLFGSMLSLTSCIVYGEYTGQIGHNVLDKSDISGWQMGHKGQNSGGYSAQIGHLGHLDEG